MNIGSILSTGTRLHPYPRSLNHRHRNPQGRSRVKQRCEIHGNILVHPYSPQYASNLYWQIEHFLPPVLQFIFDRYIWNGSDFSRTFIASIAKTQLEYNYQLFESSTKTPVSFQKETGVYTHSSSSSTPELARHSTSFRIVIKKVFQLLDETRQIILHGPPDNR